MFYQEQSDEEEKLEETEKNGLVADIDNTQGVDYNAHESVKDVSSAKLDLSQKLHCDSGIETMSSQLTTSTTNGESNDGQLSPSDSPLANHNPNVESNSKSLEDTIHQSPTHDQATSPTTVCNGVMEGTGLPEKSIDTEVDSSTAMEVQASEKLSVTEVQSQTEDNSKDNASVAGESTDQSNVNNLPVNADDKMASPPETSTEENNVSDRQSPVINEKVMGELISINV